MLGVVVGAIKTTGQPPSFPPLFPQGGEGRGEEEREKRLSVGDRQFYRHPGRGRRLRSGDLWLSVAPEVGLVVMPGGYTPSPYEYRLMRFHLGPIPEDFAADSSWRPIREPGPMLMQFCAMPLGIGAFLGVGYCWQGLLLSSTARSYGPGEFLLLAVTLLLSVPALIVFHELLHASVHPHFGRTSSTVIGAWPRRLLFYAHYSGSLSRERFLAVFIMPFIVITLLPLALAALGLLPARLAPAAAWWSTLNALFSCGDLFGMALILCQIPRNATVQNQSWRTFWKTD